MRSFILVAIVLFSNFAFGQNKVFKGNPVLTFIENTELKQKISAYDVYEIDAATMHNYLSKNGYQYGITLELGSKYAFDIDITENRIFKKDIKIKVATENGIIQGEPSKIKCYQGYIHGTAKQAALSVNEDFISGLITLDDDILFFEPLRYLIPGSPENQFIFYRSKDFKETKEFKCLAKEYDDSKKQINNKLKEQTESVQLLCREVQIAEASDKAMCNFYGGIPQVQNRITSILNAVQTNYNGSFNDNLTLTISDWFNVSCTGTDPWSNTTDPEILLGEFSDWGDNFDEHDIGQLFVRRSLQGGTAGIAWVESVCEDGFKYSLISDWTQDLSLMRCTVAHEIGHNFSCDHDAPNSGFIMAPAASFSNTWSQASKSAFNNYVPTRFCLDICGGGGFAPVADFTSSTEEGCKPLTVSFSDQSTNTPTSWSWSFPGGSPSTSTQKNPSISYNAAGVYSVTLTATNIFGSNSITKTNYITVKEKPTANFTFTKNEGAVQFTNTSTGGATSYNWSFGDGDFSTEVDPYHEYASPGMYTVNLTATNECGFNTKTTVITIVFIPEANFSSNVTSGCIPLTVNFVDESDFTPTSWMWTFPGGTPSGSTQQNPTVVYHTAGQFSVTLKVTNSAGSNTITIDKYITAIDKPIANFTSSVNGHTVSFSNTSTGTGNTYVWDFGDGDTSTEVNPNHFYVQTGDYSVKLIATNACGSTEISKPVTVLNGPKSAFSANILTGCTSLSVQFTDQSTFSPSNWQWIFEGGNPSTSTNQNPTVIYNTPGQFDVTLIVTNAIGSDTLIKSNYINVLTAPVAAFSSSVNNGTVSFTNQSTYGVGYQWNFGDSQTSTQENPVHIYTVAGVYTVTLTVTNPCGTNVITHTVEIVFPPDAGFTSDKITGCEPLTVHFTNTSSANATSYSWLFPGGNPSSSTQEDPIVVYENDGIYAVTLIAKNSAGSDTLILAGYITVQPKPVSSFTYLTAGHLTSFTNTSSNAVSWHWDFGDGDTSILENPVHEYPSEGSYTVVLSVTNNCGTTVLTKTVNIFFPPNANFSSDKTTGCNDLTVEFDDLSSANTTSWNWTFEGGTPSSSTSQNPVVVYNTVGSYDVRLIAGNAQGFDTIYLADYILISSAPPVSDFSYNSVGLTQEFVNESTDAYSYKWLFGDGDISTQKDPTHTYADGGNYTATLISYNGCGSDTISIQINVVGAAPVGGFESNITSGCVPLVVAFTDSSLSGPSSWSWTFEGGDPSSSNSQNPMVTYNTAGTYEVTLIVSNSFGSDTVTKISYIEVKDIPVGKFNYLSQGKTVVFNNTSTGATSYVWNFGDNTTSTEQSPEHIYGIAGQYTVTLTATNDCGSFVFTQTVDVKVSVNEIDFIESVNLYPNPNNGRFNISFSSKISTDISIKLLDMAGKELYSSMFLVKQGINNKEVNLLNVTAGHYLLILNTTSGKSINKIIIEY